MKVRPAALLATATLFFAAFSFQSLASGERLDDRAPNPEDAFYASAPSSTVSDFSGAQREPADNQPRLRVVTYNVHSCIGLDRKLRPDRIADILRHIDPDVIALEEVRAEQTKEIGERLGYHVFFAHADVVHGFDFGNAILTRFEIRATHLYPIGVPHREQRACARADIFWPAGNQTIHVFAVHLGLDAKERRFQAERLASSEILADPSIQGEPRILLGDFNEKFNRQDVNHAIKPLLRLAGSRSWPAFLPIIDLDRVYYSGDFQKDSVHISQSDGAMIASDHAPLVAVLEKTAVLR